MSFSQPQPQPQPHTRSESVTSTSAGHHETVTGQPGDVGRNDNAQPTAPQLAAPDQTKLSNQALMVIIAAVALVIAAGLALFAASSPDGLEWSAEELGFSTAAEQSAVADSPLADYNLSGSESVAGRMLAGALGVLITAAVAFGVFHWFRRSPARDTRDD